METGRTVGGYVVDQISFSGFLRDKLALYSLCYRQGAGLVLLCALCARFNLAVDNSLEWGGAQLPNSPHWQILVICCVYVESSLSSIKASASSAHVLDLIGYNRC